MKAIADSFNDKSEPKNVLSSGVKVNGEKYMTIESTDTDLKAKKVSLHNTGSHHSSELNMSRRAKKVFLPSRQIKPSSSPITPIPSRPPMPIPHSVSLEIISRR